MQRKPEPPTVWTSIRSVVLVGLIVGIAVGLVLGVPGVSGLLFIALLAIATFSSGSPKADTAASGAGWGTYSGYTGTGGGSHHGGGGGHHGGGGGDHGGGGGAW